MTFQIDENCCGAVRLLLARSARSEWSGTLSLLEGEPRGGDTANRSFVTQRRLPKRRSRSTAIRSEAAFESKGGQLRNAGAIQRPYRLRYR